MIKHFFHFGVGIYYLFHSAWGLSGFWFNEWFLIATWTYWVLWDCGSYFSFVLAGFQRGTCATSSLPLEGRSKSRFRVWFPMIPEGCSLQLLSQCEFWLLTRPILMFLWLGGKGVSSYCSLCGLHWCFRVGVGCYLWSVIAWLMWRSWLSTWPFLTLTHWMGLGVPHYSLVRGEA